MTKRTLERLRKAAEGKPLRIRQGDDLLIEGLVDYRWKQGYEVTAKGRAVLEARTCAHCGGSIHGFVVRSGHFPERFCSALCMDRFEIVRSAPKAGGVDG